MNKKELKQKISEILVKWSMPTRQAAINEIVKLIQQERRAARINELELISLTLYGIDSSTRKVRSEIKSVIKQRLWELEGGKDGD